MTRLELFKSYSKHPWLSRVYARLKLNEITLIEDFINENNLLNKHDFEIKINRMFIDKTKPKKWKEILELLICCNS